MTVFYWGMELLVCMWDAWCYLYALDNLIKRQNAKIKPLYYAAAFLLLTAGAVMGSTGNALLNFIMPIVLYIVYLLYGFLSIRADKKELFIAATLIHVAFGIVSVASLHMVSLVSGIPIDQLSQSATSGVRISSVLIVKLIQTFLLILSVRVRKKKSESWHSMEWRWLGGEFLIIFVMLLATMGVWLRNPYDERTQLLIGCLEIGMIAMFFMTFIMMRRSAAQYQRQREYEKLMNSIEQDRTYLEANQAGYEQTRMLLHDMKHYLGAAIGMAQQNRNEELAEYLQSVLHEQVEMKKSYVVLDNPILEAVINTKLSRMEESGIESKVLLEKGIFYPNPVNLGIILSNLMDNAIEAAVRCVEEKRIVSVEGRQKQGYLIFTISNSVDRPVSKSNPEFETTKRDKEHHGLGLKSVRKMLEEEGGIFRWYEREPYFITEIMLPITPKNDHLRQNS